MFKLNPIKIIKNRIKAKPLGSGKRIELFKKLALKRNGIVEDKWYHICLHFPCFTFKQQDTSFIVYWESMVDPLLAPYGPGYNARISIEFKLKTYFSHSKHLLLRLRQPSVSTERVCKKFASEVMELDKRYFHEKFCIHCRDHSFVEHIFDKDIQTKLLEYAEQKPYLFIYKKKLFLSFWNAQETEEEYNKFINLGLSLWGKMYSLGHC